ncbi:YPR204W-like protein [Saccharomyces cerevisiae Vin13]|nr:YPR204W-like protein [Saccharomyces cerevisiae Vin13]
MDINELKRSEDLSRGLSSYPTRMFNLIKEKSEVPLGHVHKIWKKVESQPEEALKLLLALFEIEPESKAIVVASTTNEVEELACSWRKYLGWYGYTGSWVLQKRCLAQRSLSLTVACEFSSERN